jgi:hypothetical protein
VRITLFLGHPCPIHPRPQQTPTAADTPNDSDDLPLGHAELWHHQGELLGLSIVKFSMHLVWDGARVVG